MIRPIKFRAWDNEVKVMRGMDELGSICLDALDGSDFIIEQFTGLTDKNGKEIYENDLLKFGNNNIARVLYGQAEYLLKLLAYDFDYRLSDFNSEDIEIIGNVHENTNSLEDNKHSKTFPSPKEWIEHKYVKANSGDNK